MQTVVDDLRDARDEQYRTMTGQVAPIRLPVEGIVLDMRQAQVHRDRSCKIHPTCT
jgi:hypothetical protein